MSHASIAVLDFGGQYAHLIATKIRALGIHAEIRDPDDPVESFRSYKGIILSGSPALAAFDEDTRWSQGILDLDVPIMGFCYGHQEIAKHYGGEVEHTKREYGAANFHLIADSHLLKGLTREEVVWMSHGDTVTKLPEGFIELGTSRLASSGPEHRYAAMESASLKRYGLQFHPEVDDTPCGERILSNFVYEICHLKPDWVVADQVEERVAAIRREVGAREVLLLASGGVDSTVTAVLVERAVGAARLKLLHIDNGVLRENESRWVLDSLARLGLGASVHFVDASAEFLHALDGLTEPEAKRKAIGDTFIAVFEREAKKLDVAHALLAQGTIYPDTIETRGSKRADLIKTHHNRVPLVEEMIKQGRVLEPLKDLYKVEVRELGKALGIDDSVLERHPFPGPGLGIRLLASNGVVDAWEPEQLAREIDAALQGTGLKGLALPVRSVGVKADLRSYEHPVLLTGPNPGWTRLLEVATHMAKEVHGINRVLYALDGREHRKAEPRAATVTRARLELLRELDTFVMDGVRRLGLMQEVWQCPTVLVPLSLDGQGRELVVVRPIHSERAMTARPAWLGDALAAEIREAALSYPEVSGLAIDLTTKPPSTIEWE